jgi:hypothetical protein
VRKRAASPASLGSAGPTGEERNGNGRMSPCVASARRSRYEVNGVHGDNLDGLNKLRFQHFFL